MIFGTYRTFGVQRFSSHCMIVSGIYPNMCGDLLLIESQVQPACADMIAEGD